MATTTPEININIPNNWMPRWYQVSLWKYLWAGGKRAIVIGHRRWGKDDVCLHWAAVSAIRKPATYWHMLPEAAQARKAIWEAVNPNTGKRRIDEAFPKEIREVTRENEMLIKIRGGGTWQVLGSDNYSSLVGSPPYGVVFSEWALADPLAWAYIRPILRENGGWALFITTPRGSNHAKAMYEAAINRPGWHSEVSTVKKTKVLSVEALEEERQEYVSEWGEDQGSALFEQEWMCFHPGTQIWTDKGQKRIEHILLGDMVLTHAGRWRKVTKLFQHQHEGDLIEIKSSGSCDTLVCTPNHPVRVCSPETQSYQWLEAKNIKPKDNVVLPRLKLSDAKIISPGLAELIAWFIAEGSTDRNRVTFSLNVTETGFADRIEQAAHEYGAVSRPKNDRGAMNVRVNSCWLADFLVSNCGSLASGKRIPWGLISGYEQLVYDTLIDGDGCRGKYSGISEVFTTISYSLALDVQMLAHMLGKRANINFRPASKQLGIIEGRSVVISDSYSVRISEIKKNLKYYGEHTRPKMQPQKHGVAATVTNVIKRQYSGPVFNFAVQYDESYVANGRVVHNCSFEAAIIGAYYASEIKKLKDAGRLCSVPHIPGIPVDTWWDLGYDDSTSIWFSQTVGREIHLIGYYENNNQGLIHYGQELKRRKMDLGWSYGTHTGPHDTMKHELGAGKDLKEQAAALIDPVTGEDFSFEFTVARRISNQQEGIQAVRSILPYCWFDKVNTQSNNRERLVGFASLENYRNEWDEKNKTFKNSPLHDWACLHGETKIRTLNGWIPIKDLAGKENIYLWAYDSDQKRLFPAKTERCWLSKKTNRLLRVSLDHQEDIKCTPDHRFMLRNGSWTEAENLKPGDSLMPFYENKDRGYARVHLTDGTIAEEHKFSFSVFNGYLQQGKHVHHIDGNKYNNTPENLTQMSIRDHISLHSKEPERLRKLLANNRNGKKRNNDVATAHLIAYNKKRIGELHHSTNPEFWTDEIRKKMGEKTRDLYKRSETIKICPLCKEEFLGNWKRVFCCSNCVTRSRTIARGGEVYWDTFKHSENCRRIDKSIATAVNNHKVVRVEEIFGDFDVYDISVPKHNCFVAEGVVVHNSHGAKGFETMAISHQFGQMKGISPKSAFGG